MNRLVPPPTDQLLYVETQPSRARDLLRQATLAHHSAVAGLPAMQRVFAPDFTHAEYGDHLVRLMGFYEPLERLAAKNATSPALRHHLRRSDALRRDLSRMGWKPSAIDAIDCCERLPSISTAGTWGYLYVILGSMLGGRTIADRLRCVLGPQTPLDFYGVAGDGGDARWTAFCTDLESTAVADRPEICAAADATFGAFIAWMGAPAIAGDTR